MRNGGKARFKRTKIDELMNYMVYTVRVDDALMLETHLLRLSEATAAPEVKEVVHRLKGCRLKSRSI